MCMSVYFLDVQNKIYLRSSNCVGMSNSKLLVHTQTQLETIRRQIRAGSYFIELRKYVFITHKTYSSIFFHGFHKVFRGGILQTNY